MYNKAQTSETAGFSLVELMIAVSIIGILAAVSIPSILASLPNRHLKADAMDIYGTLQRARGEAVKSNSCTGVAFKLSPNPGQSTYESFFDDGAGVDEACNGERDNDTEEWISLPTNVRSEVIVVSASDIGGPEAVCFTAGSFVNGSNSGNIQLRTVDNILWFKITVPASGGVRVEKCFNHDNDTSKCNADSDNDWKR
jgi:prepilin-type N-terminal cleavage/methylation domain-containing protein